MIKRRSRGLKSVGIVFHPTKKEAWTAACDLADWFRAAGVKCFSSPDAKTIPRTRKASTKKHWDEMNLVVVLGGDGTYLGAVRLLGGRSTPVLGVNLGSLGFLTETRIEDLYKVLELALDGKMSLRTRSMLEVSFQRKGKELGRYLALNDIVIERGPISRLINLAIYSDDTLISEMKSDGLILTTPTGSTAYNLAAGGPIIHPDTKAIAITPICPHSLTNRPITLPDNLKITIRVNASTQKAVFMLDGQRLHDVDERDVIEISKSEKVHHMLTQPRNDYFDLLNTKLNFGHRN